MLNETGIFPAASDAEGNAWEQVLRTLTLVAHCADRSLCMPQISNPVNASTGGVIGYAIFVPPYASFFALYSSTNRRYTPLSINHPDIMFRGLEHNGGQKVCPFSAHACKDDNPPNTLAESCAVPARRLRRP
jgi:hypothetical protein